MKPLSRLHSHGIDGNSEITDATRSKCQAQPEMCKENACCEVHKFELGCCRSSPASRVDMGLHGEDTLMSGSNQGSWKVADVKRATAISDQT